MKDQKLYLKYNVQLEPLFNQWYAWPHLVAPATAAMNIANSHVKIMKSYLTAPQVHAAAVKNPAMRGGPFIDYDGKRTDEIRALLDKTLSENAHMIEFAEAVKTLMTMLVSEAKGYSLEPFYEKIPEILKGYVEVIYDLNNHPSARFIEGLLYHSRFYQRSSQSVALSLVNQDERPFVFSTPRLADETHLHLQIPFDHPGLDELFKMRDTPQTFGHAKDALRISDSDEEMFSTFFTPKEPAKPQRYDGEEVRIRYFGHACVLVETKNLSVLIDPVISYHYDSEFYRYTLLDLPDTIDYVLITHSHADHLMFEMLMQLRPRIKNLIVPRSGGGALEDPSLKLILQHTGFRNVYEIDEMESIEVEGGSLTALPFFGEHADLNIRSKAAHLIRLNGKSIICAADSSNLEPKLYEHIHELIGDVDVLFLGMECEGAPLSWIYGQLLSKNLERKMDQSRRLSGSNFEKAMKIVRQLNCKQVYVYAMGMEPWLGYLTSICYTDDSAPIVESNDLVRACRNEGLLSERLFGVKEILL